jgi:hypothetical protein
VIGQCAWVSSDVVFKNALKAKYCPLQVIEILQFCDNSKLNTSSWLRFFSPDPGSAWQRSLDS